MTSNEEHKGKRQADMVDERKRLIEDIEIEHSAKRHRRPSYGFFEEELFWGPFPSQHSILLQADPWLKTQRTVFQPKKFRESFLTSQRLQEERLHSADKGTQPFNCPKLPDPTAVTDGAVDDENQSWSSTESQIGYNNISTMGNGNQSKSSTNNQTGNGSISPLQGVVSNENTRRVPINQTMRINPNSTKEVDGGDHSDFQRLLPRNLQLETNNPMSSSAQGMISRHNRRGLSMDQTRRISPTSTQRFVNTNYRRWSALDKQKGIVLQEVDGVDKNDNQRVVSTNRLLETNNSSSSPDFSPETMLQLPQQLQATPSNLLNQRSYKREGLLAPDISNSLDFNASLSSTNQNLSKATTFPTAESKKLSLYDLVCKDDGNGRKKAYQTQAGSAVLNQGRALTTEGVTTPLRNQGGLSERALATVRPSYQIQGGHSESVSATVRPSFQIQGGNTESVLATETLPYQIQGGHSDIVSAVMAARRIQRSEMVAAAISPRKRKRGDRRQRRGNLSEIESATVEPYQSQGTLRRTASTATVPYQLQRDLSDIGTVDGTPRRRQEGFSGIASTARAPRQWNGPPPWQREGSLTQIASSTLRQQQSQGTFSEMLSGTMEPYQMQGSLSDKVSATVTPYQTQGTFSELLSGTIAPYHRRGGFSDRVSAVAAPYQTEGTLFEMASTTRSPHERQGELPGIASVAVTTHQLGDFSDIASAGVSLNQRQGDLFDRVSTAEAPLEMQGELFDMVSGALEPNGSHGRQGDLSDVVSTAVEPHESQVRQGDPSDIVSPALAQRQIQGTLPDRVSEAMALHLKQGTLADFSSPTVHGTALQHQYLPEVGLLQNNTPSQLELSTIWANPSLHQNACFLSNQGFTSSPIEAPADLGLPEQPLVTPEQTNFIPSMPFLTGQPLSSYQMEVDANFTMGLNESNPPWMIPEQTNENIGTNDFMGQIESNSPQMIPVQTNENVGTNPFMGLSEYNLLSMISEKTNEHIGTSSFMGVSGPSALLTDKQLRDYQMAAYGNFSLGQNFREGSSMEWTNKHTSNSAMENIGSERLPLMQQQLEATPSNILSQRSSEGEGGLPNIFNSPEMNELISNQFLGEARTFPDTWYEPSLFDPEYERL